MSSAKYLGVIFDEYLSWNEQVSAVCKFLLRFFGIFNHIKHLASTKVVRQLYFAFVHSKIKYGIEVYGNCTNEALQKIQIIQNKLLKLLLNVDRMTPTKLIHSRLQILTIKDIQNSNIISFVNSCIQQRCPSQFNSYFTSRTSVYPIRNLGLEVSRSRTVMGSLSLKIIGANMWNSFPDQLRSLGHQKNFRKHVAKYYLTAYIT